MSATSSPRAHHYSVSVQQRVLVVNQLGLLSDLAQLRSLQRSVEQASARLKIRLVVFDNRDTDPPSDEIEREMRTWAFSPGRFDRVAVVLSLEPRLLRVTMEGIAQNRRFRAFRALQAAVTWLHSAARSSPSSPSNRPAR